MKIKKIFYPDWSIKRYSIRVDFRTHPYTPNPFCKEFPSECFLHLWCNEKRFLPSFFQFSSRIKRSATGRSRHRNTTCFNGTVQATDLTNISERRVVTTRFWSTRDFARRYYKGICAPQDERIAIAVAFSEGVLLRVVIA